ncbi:CRNS1 synthase, partial [Alectura lathami]|nr:CRNS1 synthase [Alectura lathami]
QLSVEQLGAEQPLGMKEPEWSGPEALCPGWLDEELSNGEVPEDTGDPDPATHAYKQLQSALSQEGLPPTTDRTAEPRTAGFGALDMTVCVLGSPTAFLPVLLEGGTRCPGGYGPKPPCACPHVPLGCCLSPCSPAGAMVLCLAPAWASRVPSETTPGAWSLLLSRGVSFEAGGRSTLEEFAPPRRATYVTGAFGAEGSWAGELARDLDCPTGGSAPLARWLED